MVLKAIEGFAALAEAREVKADINFRLGGASIVELSANASMTRGGPKHTSPANA